MSRNLAVREEVLHLDGHRCQICGYDGRDEQYRPWVVPHHGAGKHSKMGMGGAPSHDTVEGCIAVCSSVSGLGLPPNRRSFFGLPHEGSCHDLIERGIISIPEWDREAGILEVVDHEGRRVNHRRLWFHRRAKAEELQPIEATIQGIHRVDGSVAEALYTLWKDDAWQYLDPKAKSYQDYAADKGWDVRRAVELATLYDKGQENKIEWPPKTTASEFKRMLKAHGLINKRAWWWLTFPTEGKLIELVRRGDVKIVRKTDDEYFDDPKVGVRVGKWSRVQAHKGVVSTKGTRIGESDGKE